MSWSVEGRMYHTRAEYERALARHRDDRLRRMVDRLEIPAADTRRLESHLASAQARQHSVERLSHQVRQEASQRQEMMASQRRDIAQAFAEVEQSEQHIVRKLEELRRELTAQVDRLDEQRRVEAAATAASLDRELVADRRDEQRAGQRRQRLLEEAGQILARWKEADLHSLGLDSAPIDGLLDRARRADALEGLELARRAHDQARALDADAAWRKAKLESLREVYRLEAEELRSSLNFSPEERRDLVGEGNAALDLPLQRELDRILERIDAVQAYEDHEDRLDRLGQGLDMVSLRVGSLAAQVRDFDKLEDARLELVRNQLEGQLAKALGEGVRVEEVEPGELGLQPVEVKLKTASGEKIDCSVAIDGSLRIHHYEHVDQASCARSARKLAESLPELMAMQGEPRLDIATGAAQGTTAEKAAVTPPRTRTAE